MGLVLFCLAMLSACSQKCKTYEEAAHPSPDADAPWSAVRPGLQASIGSINVRYPKSSIPELDSIQTWKGTAWRGERISAQVVLWSKDEVPRITCEFSDFMSENENRLSSKIAQARFVRYVLTDEFADGCSRRRPEDYASHLSPDALDNVRCFHMKGKSTRPVWITIRVPAEADPGLYRSHLTLKTQGQKVHSFSILLRVLSHQLPPPAQWKFHLDLWQNPYAVARWHGVSPWSKEHWEKLKPLMKMLASAGQKVITVSINDRPWNAQTYDPFESMIEWQKKSDGTWEYDYTVFDNWIKFMMDLGIKEQINGYSLIPWTSELVYFDEKAGAEKSISIKPGSKEFKEMWRPFLKDFRAHLKERGWLERTNLAMDERAPEDMQAMLDFMDKAAPGFGIALADNHNSYQLFPDRIKDLSVSHAKGQIDRDGLKYRKSKGFATTFYVCCGNEFPNTFTFSDPAEAVFLGWYAAAAGFDGLLRWSFCSWVKDPLLDSRFRTWPAGDTYIVYPEARSSIRFERLIEGIQDAEKIRILKNEFKEAKTQEALEKLKRLNQILNEFNMVKRPDDLEGMINKGKKVLENLSR